MATTLAIYGGSFSPTGKHHWKIAILLLRYFNRVIVVPSGSNRDDKATGALIEDLFRKQILELTFANTDIEIDSYDLDNGVYRRTYELLEKYTEPEVEPWIVVGADIIPRIKKEWAHGQKIWGESNIAVIPRPDYEIPEDHLPKNKQVLDGINVEGSSTDIRNLISAGQPFGHLVADGVEDLIKNNGLYGWPKNEKQKNM